MKILIICYYYAPRIDPRSLRWTALSEEFVRRGHEVHVIAGNVSGQPSVEERNGVHVHRVGYGWLEEIMRQVKARPSSEHAAGRNTKTTSCDQKKYRVNFLGTFKKSVRRILKSVWRTIYWPDGSCPWIFPAVQCAHRLMKRNRFFDVLMTVSHPFSGHVAGLIVHHGVPGLRWLADNGDPFYFLEESSVNNFRLWRKLNYWAESRVIKAAHAFSVTTDETAELYRKLYNSNSDKILVIPPLLNKIFLQPVISQNSLFNHDAVVLLYVGGFHGTIRSPVHLLNLFEKLLKNPQMSGITLQLHFIGAEVGFIERELDKRPILINRIFSHGRTSQTLAMQAMFEADLLINIGNSTSYQLPSKVVEYMATGKPILNITTIENDTSSRKFQHYPLHFNWAVHGPNDLDGLCAFIKKNIGTAIPFEVAQTYVRDFTLNSIADRYLSAILKAN